MTMHVDPDCLIWLDGRNYGRKGGTGVTTYATALADALVAMNMPPSILLEQEEPARSSGRTTPLPLLRALHARPTVRRLGPTSLLSRDLYRSAHVHFGLRRRFMPLRTPHPPRMIHWTYPLPLHLEGALNITTIHDLIPLTHPHLTGIDSKRFRRLINEAVTRADAIITVSETVRRQIIERLGTSPDKITNLSQPVEFSTDQLTQIAGVPPIAADGAFIFVGRIEARKNIDRLLKAHARSRTRTPLILIGPDGDDAPDLSSRAPTSTVIRIPWIDRIGLLRTLMGAKALLFPSLAEGFGLPILEAMALGTPVMTSRGGATEEIGGDAALLVDPYDIDAMADAIARLDTPTKDGGLPRSLIAKGHARRRAFSRENFRNALGTFYRQIGFDRDAGQ